VAVFVIKNKTAQFTLTELFYLIDFSTITPYRMMEDRG